MRFLLLIDGAVNGGTYETQEEAEQKGHAVILNNGGITRSFTVFEEVYKHEAGKND